MCKINENNLYMGNALGSLIGTCNCVGTNSYRKEREREQLEDRITRRDLLELKIEQRLGGIEQRLRSIEMSLMLFEHLPRLPPPTVMPQSRLTDN